MSYATIPDFTGGTELTSTELNVVVDAINALFPVGFYGYMCRAATTTETLINGVWLECNAVSVLREAYPDLNTLWSGMGYPFGTVDGTHMTLPDAQGRSLVNMAASGHTDVSALNKNDGLTKTTRRPTHNHTFASGGASGGPFVTGGGSVTIGAAQTSTGGNNNYNAGVTGTFSVTGYTTGSVSGGSVTRVGPTGTNPTDATPYLVAGTLYLKAFA